MSKWIRFDLHTKGDGVTRKTGVWKVVALSNSGWLGCVAWFGSWRKYAFFPDDGCIFEEDCLRDIADFCETKTREHKLSNSTQKVG